MAKKEEKESYKQFVKERGPEYAKSLKDIAKKNREEIHGKGVITRGKHKGLKKGTGKG